MKITAHRFIAALFGAASLALSDAASAQTVIRITGAQAFGDAVHRGIKSILTPGGAFTYAYTGTDINNAQQTIWTGSLGGDPVVFKTSYNGSTAGIRVVTKNTPINFLANSTPQTAAGTSLPTSGNAVESIPADAAAVDTYQSSTLYTTPVLVDRLVGAGAYVFVVSKDAPAALNNITTQQAQSLWNTGSLPLANFTNLESDRTTLVPPNNLPAQVFATGRDAESGARVVTFIESRIGAFSSVQQYRPVVSGANVTSHALYPAVTLNGIFFPEGTDGNPSNNNLATVVTKSTLSTLGGYYITYLPVLNANSTAVPGGARILAYNGVPYSPQNLAEGSYTLWAYEHILYKATLTTAQKNALDVLSEQIRTVDATLKVSDLHVTRPVDGGIITATY